jgi:hypothetical protein
MKFRLRATSPRKMQNYVGNGGKVILSGRSGMNPENTQFVLDAGLDVEGRMNSTPITSFPAMTCRLRRCAGASWCTAARGKVRPKDGTRVLAQRAVPYFNRRGIISARTSTRRMPRFQSFPPSQQRSRRCVLRAQHFYGLSPTGQAAVSRLGAGCNSSVDWRLVAAN